MSSTARLGALALLAVSTCTAFAPTTTNIARLGRHYSSPATVVEPPPPAADAGAAEAANPRKLGLALQLDDGTRKSHSVAENTAFVTGFFRGMSNRDSFATLLASLHAVYEAMEAALDDAAAAEDPSAGATAALRALDFPELRRLPAIERDMAFFFGADWRAARTARPSPAAAAYAARVREVAGGPTPELLIGHLYSRYLGDLFGGQMMAGMAQKSLALEKGSAGGLAFYDFEEVRSIRRSVVPATQPFSLSASRESSQAISQDISVLAVVRSGGDKKNSRSVPTTHKKRGAWISSVLAAPHPPLPPPRPAAAVSSHRASASNATPPPPPPSLRPRSTTRRWRSTSGKLSPDLASS